MDLYGKIMSTINETLRSFDDGNGGIAILRPVDPFNDETEYIYITDEIEKMLDDYDVTNEVELVEAFDGPAATYFVLCISFVVDGELAVYNVPVYE